MTTTLIPTSSHRADLLPTKVLDEALRRLQLGAVAPALHELFTGLDEGMASVDDATWNHFAREVAAAHPLTQLIHQDPMIRRSYQKPRGYAGDAVLIDYIYGLRNAKEASPLGRAVNDYCSTRVPIRAVQARRHICAHAIDRCAERLAKQRAPSPRILSVAAGHLREATLSNAIATAGVRELVALDADAESLRVARQASPAVTAAHMSVRRLVVGRTELGSFDLIYSSGLYDYLDDRIAKRLTRSLFAMLEPGGRLLLCNFLPTTPDIGFMEAIMGWELIYRDRRQIEELAAEVPGDQIASVRFSQDAFAAIGYLELERKA